jgi:hypothetical protein
MNKQYQSVSVCELLNQSPFGCYAVNEDGEIEIKKHENI